MSGDGAKRIQSEAHARSTESASLQAAATPGKTTLVEQNARRHGGAAPLSGKRDTSDGGAFPAMPAFAPNQKQYDLFFDIHRTNLLEATTAMLRQAHWPDPAPDAPFAAGGDRRFTASVNAAIRSRIAHWEGHRMAPLLYPGNPLDAFRQYIAADKDQMHEVAWSPMFGDAFARLVHQSIYESLRQRIGPRYRAALEHMMDWPEADQLIAGHPIDPIVAAAITPPETVDRGQIAVVNASGPPKLKNVTAKWLGHENEELWNFVEVTPAGASVEDVAAALWKDPKQTTNAYALTKVGDVFRVAPAHARSVLRRLYPDEVIGDTDSNPSRAQQLLVLSKSKIGERVRARWTSDAVKATKNKPDPKKDTKHAANATDQDETKQAAKAEGKEKPSLTQIMEIEASIGSHLEKLRIAVAGLGMSNRLAEVISRHAIRMTALASGEPATIDKWLPVLQFQHTQLISIGPRIPPLVEKLLPVFYIPPNELKDAKQKSDRENMSSVLSQYLDAANTSDDPPTSGNLLAGVLGKEKQSALEGIGQVQDSTRQATRDGVATRVGAQQGSTGIDDELTRVREDAMSGRNKGSGQYTEKKTLIRAGEISLRNRMNNVEQSIVMLREAAAAAGFGDVALLKKVLPNVKPLPQVLLDVHDHLRAVDRVWAGARAEFDENEAAQAVPQDAPEDWADWQERQIGLDAAREAFARIAGDEDIGTFLREAHAKVRTQQMINAVTTMAGALLITLATGMGAAAFAEVASVALVGESMTLAAQFTKGAIQVAISAPINSIVQLAVSGHDASFGKAMLENALMDAFSRLLMFPLKEAERLAMAEVRQISQLQHVTATETKAMASASSYAGTMMLAEGLTGMATMWAANRLVSLVSSTQQEVTEPFALTVLQQGAAIGLGRFFAGRMSAWQERRKQLALTRVGSTPEMHALFAARDAFYADAQKLENHPSPEPGAADTFSKRDAALLRDERVALGRDTAEPAATDRQPARAPETTPAESKKPAPPETAATESTKPANDGPPRDASALLEVRAPKGSPGPDASNASPKAKPGRPDTGGTSEIDSLTSSLPILDKLETATGVQKGPAYDRDMADLRQFYADQEGEAQQGVARSGVTQDGQYGWRYGNKAFTFSHGVVNFEVRVHLDTTNVTPAEVQQLKAQVHAGVDRHYNTQKLKVRGPDGAESQLHLEIVFVDDAATSDIQVKVLPGNGPAHLNEWYVDGKPTTHAHEVTHGGFGIKDEYHDATRRAPNRADPDGDGVYNDQSIMGNYWVGSWQDGVVDPGTSVKQRHLDEISQQVPPRPSQPNQPTRSPYAIEPSTTLDGNVNTATRREGEASRPEAPSASEQSSAQESRAGDGTATEQEASQAGPRPVALDPATASSNSAGATSRARATNRSRATASARRGPHWTVESASDVPSIRGGAFDRWFDSLSVGDLEALWARAEIRRVIEQRLRAPGGFHEWHLVARAPTFKGWGLGADAIRGLRTKIEEVAFKNPAGGHGLEGSTTAHNELLAIIDSSQSYGDFVRRLQNWAHYRLEGGAERLPGRLALEVD
ncbi:MAG: hypothetical protein JNL83_09085 [Myxococcales bacterium]|nr:hypothetical protein [Myxococcales bacterium]